MLAVVQKVQRSRRVKHSHGPGTFVSNFLTQNGSSTFLADQDGFGETVQEITGDKAKNYTYRADGRISSFSSGNLSVNYFYDGLDRLVAKAINDNGNVYTQSLTYLGDEGRVLLGKAGNGTITTYIEGQGVADRLGEVTGGVGKGYLTDNLGSVLNSAVAGSFRSFGLFGESNAAPAISISSPAIEFGYAGYRFNREDGTYGTDSRHYNPVLGRWLSQDPIGFASLDLNYYRYVGNNPLLYIDPYGEMKLPSDPKDLPPGWKPDPSHRDPNGDRYRYKDTDQTLDFHHGRPDETGWRKKDHWHDSRDKKKHHKPGDEIPDPEEPKKVKIECDFSKVPMFIPAPVPPFLRWVLP